MKKLCKFIVMGGALSGMVIGGAMAYLSAVVIKNNTSMTDMCKSKAKDAFKCLGNKFCI